MPTATMPNPKLDLAAVNTYLAGGDASRIITWAAETFGSGLAMSSSFGIQAAVMLHLATRIAPDIPVIFIDTGYLPPETYQFAEDLRQRLGLNLHVYQPSLSPARMEALHGKLWESDNVEDLNRYDRLRKVEPMQRAVADLGVTAMLAGLRRGQTEHRQSLPYVNHQNDRYNVYPILDWTGRQVHEYLEAHGLPYHPLREQGYATVGDWHSSRPVTEEDAHERDSRFRGLKQECGLHLPQTKEEDQSLESAGL